jgi:hypothetical protein
MTRGNHESRNMTKIYGFEGEVRHKFDAQLINLFYEVFCWLPLAACIDKVGVGGRARRGRLNRASSSSSPSSALPTRACSGRACAQRDDARRFYCRVRCM